MSFNEHSTVIVTPVFEDVEASSRLFKELESVFGRDVFVVAVDDGSVKQPVSPDAITDAGLEGTVLRLRRNVGHQRAIAIGLSWTADKLADNQRVVVMDSDGEDLPQTIPALLEALAPDVDVVVAQRKSRVETIMFKTFYVFYKAQFEFLTGRKISFGNFMALTPAAVRRLVSMQETNVHVAAAVLASKLRTKLLPLDRGPRYAGQSKMNFVGLALHGFRALMVFAEDVLVRVGILCMVIAGLSVLGAIVAIILKIFDNSSPGWFSISSGILFVLFLQTGTLTLMTLMLTGVVRSGNVVTAIDYADFVERELPTRGLVK
jgi:glycosyltransferase involved in cell wall biosynthesis